MFDNSDRVLEVTAVAETFIHLLRGCIDFMERQLGKEQGNKKISWMLEGLELAADGLQTKLDFYTNQAEEDSREIRRILNETGEAAADQEGGGQE